MIGLVRPLLSWLAGGSAIAALVSIAAAICVVAFTIIYRRYVGILGADRRRPAERQAYDALRNSLAGGNLAARLYVERLTGFLGWIDRFFLDAGKADRTLFPHAFGLKKPAPLWTAPAFDRCLLIALIYPIMTIIIIWAISGHVGPAEQALHLPPNVSDWGRAAAVAGCGFSGFAFWRFMWTQQRSRLILWCALWFAGAVTAAIGIARTVASGVALFGITLFGSALGGLPFVFAVSGASFRGSVSFAFVVATILGVSSPGVGILAMAGAVAVLWVSETSVRRGWQGAFLSAFLASVTLVCLAAARLLTALEMLDIAGPLLLFLGLLTIINAPCDWAALGLTRALLRRGLELGGWWPYTLGLVDAGLAAVIIAALVLAMVVGVQAFDALAEYGGGRPVLPLEAFFDGIAAYPGAPEYWWVYALLLSSMIPSLINLIIGGTSLLRGAPGLPSLLLRKIPVRGNVPKFDRAWIAAVLTAQVAAGVFLGIAAQVLLAAGVLGYIMPFFGLELLDMARDVAALDLPMKLGQLVRSL